jgi:hypothetical protein
VSASGESELIAQELSGLGHKLNEFEKRLTEVEKVNARLELAALTTARALQEASQHWDAVYEAMRRKKNPVSTRRRERDSSLSPLSASPDGKMAEGRAASRTLWHLLAKTHGVGAELCGLSAQRLTNFGSAVRCPDFVHVRFHACASLLSSGDGGLAYCGTTAGSINYMSYSNGLGGRYVDLGILRALGSVGPEPVTAREIALTVATSTGSVAPTLRSLVKGGSCSGIGESSGQFRTYAITMAGREYLALRPEAALVVS